MFYKVLCDVLGGATYPCWERWVRTASLRGLPNGANEAHPFLLSGQPRASFQPIKAGQPWGSGSPQLGNPGALPLPGSQGDTHTHTRKSEEELNLHLVVGVCYSWLLSASQLVCALQGPAPNKSGRETAQPPPWSQEPEVTPSGLRTQHTACGLVMGLAQSVVWQQESFLPGLDPPQAPGLHQARWLRPQRLISNAPAPAESLYWKKKKTAIFHERMC